jgi:hypothetical protein
MIFAKSLGESRKKRPALAAPSHISVPDGWLAPGGAFSQLGKLRSPRP